MQTKYLKDITICESLKYQQFSITCLKVTILEMGSERQKGAGETWLKSPGMLMAKFKIKIQLCWSPKQALCGDSKKI